MKKQKNVWKKGRYGTYYQKMMGKDVKMPISIISRYGAYYQKMMGRDVKMPVSITSRYAKFYQEIYVNIQNEKNWRNYLKRINTLKKDIKSLGKVPAEGSSLVTSIKYFAKLVRLASEFQDEGILEVIPEDKVEEASEFTEIVIGISCKENVITISWKTPHTGKERLAQYWNQAKENEKVTYNNLCLGIYTRIEPDEDTSQVKVTIRNQKYKVNILMLPVSEWINNKVKDTNREDAKERQRAFSEINREWVDALLKAIDKVLA